MPGTNKGIINMTTYLQYQPVFKSSWGNFALAISKFLERRAVHARLAREFNEIQTLDMHMLRDVGLKGFEHATLEEKKRMLTEAIQQH
jgi:hypothetical protein